LVTLKNSEWIIIDPQWLAKIMATLISFKNQWKSGIVPASILPKIWTEFPVEIHSMILQLLETFEVIYKVKNASQEQSEDIIIPCLLPSQFETQFKFPKEILAFKVRTHFFSSNNFFHRKKMFSLKFVELMNLALCL
jgi:hypothetical protein